MRHILVWGTNSKVTPYRRQWIKPTSLHAEVLRYPKIQGMWIFGCGPRLFRKGISHVYFSYHMLPSYTQRANACSDTFAHDLVSQGWKGQPLSSGIPWQNSWQRNYLIFWCSRGSSLSALLPWKAREEPLLLSTKKGIGLTKGISLPPPPCQVPTAAEGGSLPGLGGNAWHSLRPTFPVQRPPALRVTRLLLGFACQV